LRESAYKYAQMLIFDQDYATAVTVYDLLLSVTEEREQSRQIMLEQSEMALKAADQPDLTDAAREALYQKAEKNFTEVLWGGMDLWFGRALTSYAQYMVLRGNRDQARRMLQSNIRLMRDMDKQLQDANIPIGESPMAGARSLLGKLYREEGEAMIAPDARRHAEALDYFERAVQYFDAEWQLMDRAKRREDAAREKAADGAPLTASTPTPERMRPYTDLRAALESMIDTFSQAGWNEAVTERARALEGKVRELFNTVREANFEPGISPNLGITIDEKFRGNVALQQGRLFLRSEDDRKKDAVQHLVRSLTEYYNVFADYAGSHWSTTAGEVVANCKRCCSN
jgi:tetratricopeptide (TPR) repeat protein